MKNVLNGYTVNQPYRVIKLIRQFLEIWTLKEVFSGEAVCHVCVQTEYMSEMSEMDGKSASK